MSDQAGQTGSPAAPARHLLECELSELEQWLAELGEPRYRAAQLVDWIYAKGATSFAGMSNLPKALRARLEQQAVLARTTLLDERVARDGTRKLLLALADGARIECVWIPGGQRNTACLSTQVGCPVGCRFCASGLDGLERNLTAGEIVEQALWVRRLVSNGRSAGAPRLSNIVIMGMGEPLANYRALVGALRILNAPWGLGLGARRITVSTIGLPQQIRRLAGDGLPVNLALSLHATDNALRRELIPWAERVPLAAVLDACAYYFRQTGREVTLEYVLLAGVNMRPQHADRLAAIARQLRANVNLLRYNPVPGLPFERPTAAAAYAFEQRLRARGVNVHLRRSRGAEVAAACGQLRRTTDRP